MKQTMSLKKRWYIRLVLYMVFLLIWSVAVLVMPIASAQKEVTKIPMYISGGCFWFGLIGTITMAVNINLLRRKNATAKNKHPEGKQLGILSFFRNKWAKIADIVMFASGIGFATVKLWINNIYLLFILAAIFLFSFGMHCMLNGKSYSYLNYKVRREKKS